MSKVKKVLEIAREELAKSKGKTIPKDEMIGTLDSLIKALPQAAAMDEQQLDIMITYNNFINAKLDLLFNATTLCGLGISNDMKVRLTIKQMQERFSSLDANFERSLERIVDPEAAAEKDKAAAEARKAAGTGIIGGANDKKK